MLAEGHLQVGQLRADSTAQLVNFLRSVVPLASRRYWRAG